MGTLYTHQDKLIHCSFFTGVDETPDTAVNHEWMEQRIVF
jgi:hypothetical protein